MYDGDSFFTLGLAARIGLLMLSGILLLGSLALVYRLCRGRHLLFRVMIAGIIFLGFLWASPQIYYGYYLLIFDGLPRQWVIGLPPSIYEMVEIVSFTGRGRLADHGQGILFWCLLAVALRSRRKRGEHDRAP